MIFMGGFVTSIILVVVVVAAIVFKSRRKSSVIKTGSKYEVAFWASVAMILFVGVWVLGSSIYKGMKKAKAKAQTEEVSRL